MAQAGAQKPRPQWEDTKVAKKKVDAMSAKIARELGYDSPKTRVAPNSKPAVNGSVAKTFNTSKLMPKMTPQDKASLKILQELYGEKPYKSYTKKP